MAGRDKVGPWCAVNDGSGLARHYVVYRVVGPDFEYLRNARKIVRRWSNREQALREVCKANKRDGLGRQNKTPTRVPAVGTPKRDEFLEGIMSHAERMNAWRV
jgi:hypothetical protein